MSLWRNLLEFYSINPHARRQAYYNCRLSMGYIHHKNGLRTEIHLLVQVTSFSFDLDQLVLHFERR